MIGRGAASRGRVAEDRAEPGVISMIVVNYNSGPLLTGCVRALLESEEAGHITVVDNASLDDSLERLIDRVGDRESLEIVRNTANLGFAAANNQGLGHTDSRYIALVNPDCFVRPDTLGRLRAAMDANPQAGIAGCMIRDEDGSEQVGTRRAIPTPWSTFVHTLQLHRLFPGNPRFRDFNQADHPVPERPIPVEAVSGALMFVRRAALSEVGPMDEDYFLHCEDLDWFMRLRQGGWNILFVPDAEAYHVKGACSRDQPVRVLWYKHRGMLRFYRKFFRSRYPRPLFVLVSVAVWGRFAVTATLAALRRRSSRIP